MHLTENQRWIVDLLNDNGGRWRSGIPRRAQIHRAQMIEDIGILIDQGLLCASKAIGLDSVDGPDSVQLWLAATA